MANVLVFSLFITILWAFVCPHVLSSSLGTEAVLVAPADTLCLHLYIPVSLLVRANESANTCALVLLPVIGGCGRTEAPSVLPVRLQSSLKPSGLQTSVL